LFSVSHFGEGGDKGLVVKFGAISGAVFWFKVANIVMLYRLARWKKGIQRRPQSAN
jgi:hypothetical protein